MTIRRLFVALALLAAPLGAQGVTGFTRANGDRQRQLERAAVAVPAPERAATHSRALSSEPHVAGTPAQARTRDYVIEQMKRLGLETEVRAYDIWMPHPTSVRAWRVDGAAQELDLREGPIAGDTTLGTLGEVPPINGYAGSGDVTGEVVFVNYGLIEDYAQLAAMGVSVRGKIAVARYGRSFRGIKAREAEKNGALALVIYSDPQDDGYARGDVYPEGPMRPPQGIQRGGVANGNGDPTTPGWASVAGARRIAPAEANVPHIPVVPIGYGNAALLLKDLRGTPIPAAWQGGLPFRYHVGPGPVRARIAITTDTATRPLKTIWNTYGIIRGRELPDEMVIIGGHRDSWGPGAADNVSGTVSILEAARAVQEQVQRGQHPRRTIVFATWDAEEWGLIGSTEYVEDDSLRLMRGAVAYLNQDVSAQGSAFGGGGSPSMRSMLRDVARQIDDPRGGSVYARWRTAANLASDTLEPPMGDPGGGSDFAGFYNHLGIPHADWGFGGGGGVYHSMFDSFAWMSRFGDPGFTYHAMAARVGAAMLLRLANADVLPYDYVEYARTMRRYLPALDRAIAAAGGGVDVASLAAAVAQMETSARAFANARDAALAGTPAPAALRSANGALLGVERALTRPEGLRSRPWFRNLIYAADEDNGYATIVFPSVNEALRRRDQALARTEMADLAARFGAASRKLDEARAALEGATGK
ncbi:MAG: M20/M25/M40 family metallo-hydrolase [Gemmatimonadetes bacterium]|nr:M20/M25/M40 family metallo-hydrolase [Gemmatimonadota bacterium]